MPSRNAEVAKNLPTVTGKTLLYQKQGHEQLVRVGTPAWYAWLQQARAFTFRTSSRQFTVRKEQARGLVLESLLSESGQALLHLPGQVGASLAGAPAGGGRCA
jgi:hypothetical protein